MHPMEKTLHQTCFLVSASKRAQCPPDEGYEVAFAGRSNAGKSSAINKLTGQKQLARTSKTPGRTRLLNFFSVDAQRRLVDLPGYGYAKANREIRMAWQRDLDDYLSHRQCLRGLVLLTDIRHPLKEVDMMIIHWAQQAEMPLHVLLTKADKLGHGAASSTLSKTRKTLQQEMQDTADLASVQLFSAQSGKGCDAAWDKLAEWFDLPDSGTFG